MVYICDQERPQYRGKTRKESRMDDNMTSKEFDLLITMILEMLKEGKTEKVIELLEKAIKKDSDN